ncbi:UDP-2-acetamido-3-amino-2,3-dideoxy-D-glucuronate N-acetyltransferase [Holospora obtusa F1]|uniref:UDP-2-acetamido-3-amino-2, 3-dideoxy-D-glucuronate N-acetyltransferase n=1 Tax=Holospora obtusa F1 TaxID=1399147 RepID=W6TEH0_HOLOB|nr:Gfo/Idh/MocA family oxidoreductase [Holospora obtusa]ETZ07144.1 UDP-2-acetamido-3-amino-2,3-dideoxy-D-glucuronate N-acetyltransferase [Holospora obtusa F1]
MLNPKISVIGCGYWGKNLVRNFAELGVLHSVCDANQELAKQAAQTYDVASLSLEELLKSNCDGVVIAAPAAQHYELTKASLNAGKYVFVEKPLSLKVEEAQKLCDLSMQVGRKLMVGHLLQYHPAFLELKSLIQKGNLGRLQYIYSNRLNLGKFRNEENILWSFAPHDISMILGLAADLPESVYATGACHLNPRIHDVTTTHMSFKNGIEAHIFVSWLHPYKEQKLVVVGDCGMAVFDDGLPWGEKLKLYPHQVTWIDGLPQPEKADVIHVPLEVSEPLKIECQHFIDCITQNQNPRTDGAEGLRVLQVLDAAQQSLHTHQAVSLNAQIKPYYVHETAIVDGGCDIGRGTKIWHFSHIIKGTKIGEDCVIAQNVMIGPDVVMGNRCKIQNNVSLYKGVTLEDGVFCGPSCVFTNVHNPRAEIERKDEYRPTLVERGVTIGANATIVCGNKLGAYSLIGAGAVITRDVKPHAVMVGNPAKHIGWVSHAGEKLGDNLVCPREGRRYQVIDENLKEISKNDTATKTA